MRILMTADTVGGVWTYALELTQALAQYDVEVHLATMGNPLTEQQRKQASRISNLSLYTSQFRLEWMDSPWEDVNRAGHWLQTLAVKIKPNIVHLNGYTHASLNYGAPVIVVAHSCVYSWWNAVKSEDPPPHFKEYRCSVESGLRYADRVIAPTQTMLQSLHQHYHFVTQEHVIPNGVYACEYQVCPKEPFVFSVGRIWDEAKNIAALNRIVSRLGYPIYVAGADVSPDGENTDVSSLAGLGFLAKDDLNGWYGRAAVYALPAYYEPFGLSVLEAALSGCALVLGDIASLRENWADVACFVPPDDDEAILSALQKLMANPELYAYMGQKARQRGWKFGRDHMAQAYWNIYQEAAS